MLSLQGQGPEVESQNPYKHTGFDGVYLQFQNWEGRGGRGFLNRKSNLLDDIKANEKTLYERRWTVFLRITFELVFQPCPMGTQLCSHRGKGYKGLYISRILRTSSLSGNSNRPHPYDLQSWKSSINKQPQLAQSIETCRLTGKSSSIKNYFYLFCSIEWSHCWFFPQITSEKHYSI